VPIAPWNDHRYRCFKIASPENEQLAYKAGTTDNAFARNHPLSESINEMSAPTPNTSAFAAAESAICKLGSHYWFSGLTREWQDFLVSKTVETFNQYQVTMDQAAQKLIEFYVEITQAYPEAKNNESLGGKPSHLR